MKWRLFFVASLFTLVGSELSALLPPLQQSRREIESILTYPKLDDYLPSGDLIYAINRVDGGYIIITNRHVLKVSVVYEKAREIGPAKYKLVFHEAIAIPEKKASSKANNNEYMS